MYDLTNYQGHVTYNRTILELKLNGDQMVNQKMSAYNRTILELKPYKLIYLFFEQFAYNRTILELKRKSRKVHKDMDILIIAPFWN